MTDYNFDDIRCYNDDDVPAKLWPLADVPEIKMFIQGAMPDADVTAITEQMRHLTTIDDFQRQIVIRFLALFSHKCTDELVADNIDTLDASRGHLFITNHRDIVLDSAFLNTLLSLANIETSEIAIGNNLFAAPWIEDLVRLNKSFVVRRDVAGRELLQASMKLSAYIHREITEGNHNIWMAQREGRSKDSSDLTQSSVIKMLAMGGSSRDLMQNIRHLNLLPVAISYEFDPCDFLKAAEFQLKRDNPDWKKSKSDDVRSMITGMQGHKGRVHYTFTQEINKIFDTYPWINDKTAQVNCICQTIDTLLHGAMHLYPINYLAYDTKYQTNKYAACYTQEESDKATNYLNAQLAKVDIPNRDETFLWNMLLTQYSNPVLNKERLEREPSLSAKPFTD